MRNEKKRKVHNPEFKAKVGLEAVRGVKTISEIAQEAGSILLWSGNGRKRFWKVPAHCLIPDAVPNLQRLIRAREDRLYGEIGPPEDGGGLA